MENIVSRSRVATALAVILAAVVMDTGARAQETDQPVVEMSLVKPLASHSLLLDGVVIEGRMVVVGERGHILVSDDDGETWVQSAGVPTRATLTGVHFHDRELGWVVGHDAVILRTRDGGESWQLLQSAPEEERPFLDVWFFDAEHGYVIGAYGYFLETFDAGESWSDRVIAASEEDEFDDAYDLGGDFHLNHIARSATGVLYITAEAGNIYRSDDDGESWSTLDSPYHGSFFGSLPLDGDSILVFGLRGNLFRSDDKGLTWREIETGTVAILNDGLRLRDGRYAIAGTAGVILLSEDGGETFGLSQQADRQALATLLATDEESVTLVGEFGVKTVISSSLSSN